MRDGLTRARTALASREPLAFEPRPGLRVAARAPALRMVVSDAPTAAEVEADLADLEAALGDGVASVFLERPPLARAMGRTVVAEAGTDAPLPAMAHDRTLFLAVRPNGVGAALLARRRPDGLELREVEFSPTSGLVAPMAVRTFLPDEGGVAARRLLDPLSSEAALHAAMFGPDANRTANRARRAATLTRDAHLLVAYASAFADGAVRVGDLAWSVPAARAA